MDDWKEKELEDVSLYINRGFSPKYVEEDGVLIINQRCIRNGVIDYSLARLTSKSKKITQEKILVKDDVLINSTGVGTAGRVSIFKEDILATADTHVSILRIDPSKSYPKFIFHNLRGREKEVEGIAEGSTGQIELGRSRLKQLDLLLPPLQEQKAIAEVLSSLDDKIDLLHRQNETLEEMAQTLFRQWFENVEFDSTISDLVGIKNGYAFKSKDFLDFGNNRVIKIKNISDDAVDITTSDFVSDSIVKNIDSKFRISTGDILFAMTGAKIGKMGLVGDTDENLWLNQRVGLLKEKYLDAKFLAYITLTSEFGQDYIRNAATGSAQPNISATGIEQCPFPRLEMAEIKKYSEKLSSLYNKVIFNLGQIQTLEKLRDNLLPKLMSGEVRVNLN